ncbi:MAG: site-specific integrase, partial [Deltaproteobacteria bacterium]
MSVRKIKQRNGSNELVEFFQIDVTYVSRDGHHQRVRKTATIQNAREAKREEAEILAQLVAGTWRRKGSAPASDGSAAPASGTVARTFSEGVADYLAWSGTNNRKSTGDEKRTAIRLHLEPFFGKMLLSEIGSLPVERYKTAMLKARLKAKTVNNHLRVLHKMLVLAKEWGWLEEDVPSFKSLKVPEPELRYLSFDEAELLIRHAGEYEAFITFMLNTGVRIGEALALRWRDVDLDGRCGVGVVRHRRRRHGPGRRRRRQRPRALRSLRTDSKFELCTLNFSRARLGSEGQALFLSLSA